MKKRQDKENYLIFARKFRPETFEEIVGQEAIARLLQMAIRTGRIPQNFLFSGPRGIGKTSTARILAKALNCVKGPTETPCNDCVICDEITRSFSLDVLEIDGASHRGIEEIRTLRENVKFKPAQARFKIYLIDEVHMLTGEAFNALLKTLEEPPGHVKFIFATTEPHKVPLTILSRCQRFNFKRIPTEKMVEKLAEIAQAEKLAVDPKALFLIARVSDGSLRDAETLLDQLSLLSEGELREEEVLFALGLASEAVYFELLEALQKKEARKIFSLTQTLYESGKDLVQFGRGLYELFRNLLLLQIGQGAESFIEMSPESLNQLRSFQSAFSREELLLILSLFQNLQGELRRSLAPPKLLLETLLLKLLHLEGLHEVKALLEKTKEGSTPPPLLPSPASAGQEIQEEQTKEGGGTRSFALAEVERLWPEILEAVKTKEMSTGMFLAEAEPVEVTGEAIVLGLPEEFRFHKEMLERPEKRKLVEETVAHFLGLARAESRDSTLQIQFVTTRIQAQRGAPSQGKEQNQAGTPARGPLPEIVRQAMDIFQGGKVVRSE